MALKVLGLAHKTEKGGVRLGLAGGAVAQTEADLAAELGERLQSVHPRHLEIQEHDVDVSLGDDLKRLDTAPGELHFESFPVERGAADFSDALLIVHYQHCSRFRLLALERRQALREDAVRGSEPASDLRS